jgi:hypothetical protein
MIYAAYGSNLNHAQMSVRCPKAKFIGVGILRNHRLVFRRFCDIEPAEGYSVPVGLWKLTADCLAALDRYEGFPSHYGRTRMPIATPNRKTVQAITYFMNYVGYELPGINYVEAVREGYVDCGLPFDRLTEALEHVIDVCRADYWQSDEPTEYVDEIARESCTQD